MAVASATEAPATGHYKRHTNIENVCKFFFLLNVDWSILASRCVKFVESEYELKLVQIDSDNQKIKQLTLMRCTFCILYFI